MPAMIYKEQQDVTNGHGTTGGHPSVFRITGVTNIDRRAISHIVGRSPSISSTAHRGMRGTVSTLKCHPDGSTHTLTSRHSHAVNLITNKRHFCNPVSTVSSVRTVTERRKLFVSIDVIRRTLYSRARFSRLYSAFSRVGISTFVFLAPASIVFSTTYHTRVARPHIVIASARNDVDIRSNLHLVGPTSHHQMSMIKISR